MTWSPLVLHPRPGPSAESTSAVFFVFCRGIRSFAQVESSGPSFIDAGSTVSASLVSSRTAWAGHCLAGESHCNSVVAESNSGSVLGRQGTSKFCDLCTLAPRLSGAKMSQRQPPMKSVRPKWLMSFEAAKRCKYHFQSSSADVGQVSLQPRLPSSVEEDAHVARGLHHPS